MEHNPKALISPMQNSKTLFKPGPVLEPVAVYKLCFASNAAHGFYDYNPLLSIGPKGIKTMKKCEDMVSNTYDIMFMTEIVINCTYGDRVPRLMAACGW